MQDIKILRGGWEEKQGIRKGREPHGFVFCRSVLFCWTGLDHRDSRGFFRTGHLYSSSHFKLVVGFWRPNTTASHAAPSVHAHTQSQIIIMPCLRCVNFYFCALGQTALQLSTLCLIKLFIFLASNAIYSELFFLFTKYYQIFSLIYTRMSRESRAKKTKCV